VDLPNSSVAMLVLAFSLTCLIKRSKMVVITWRYPTTLQEFAAQCTQLRQLLLSESHFGRISRGHERHLESFQAR
jgi:hypothetical protein